VTAPRPIVLILGPTAGGKTALALELARRLPGPDGLGGECVCADSMQIYRGMDIGTAKPTAAERASVPHHLLDLLEPGEEGFSVDAWLARAEAAIAEIRTRNRWPIVVGGTNLYVQALLHGLFEGPAPDPALRARLAATEPEQLRRRLESVDPEAAGRIHPRDHRRTVRALEVFEQTGRRISDLQRQWHADGVRRDVRVIGLDYPREAINRRINARVKAMMDSGLLDETRTLWRAGVLGGQAGEALGYRQLVEHLEGSIGLDEAVEQIKIATRRFAKMQRTWLRRFRQLDESRWFAADELTPQTLAEQALNYVTGVPKAPHGSQDLANRTPGRAE
jgi:tRNA dimethylallyltransferase